jgi:hypothetical protein
LNNLAKRYRLCRTPTGQKTGGYWEADILAEKAKAVWRKTFDLLAQMHGGAELRDAEIRRCRPADRTLRGVHQKEPAFDEVRKVAALPAQLPKDVK